MKVLFKSFLLALTLLAAFSAIVYMTASAAQGRPMNPTSPVEMRSAVFPSSSASVLNVIVEKSSSKPVVIRLVDKKGNILGSQITGKKSGNYRVKFNIEQLTDGEYEVELVNGETISHHSFSVSTPTRVSVNRTIALQ
ncbi:hypothetical protein GCM10027341_32210 [Spirosoma knui]